MREVAEDHDQQRQRGPANGNWKTSLPLPLSFLWPMLAAVLAGGLWGAIAGVLKARAGTNEVISTLLPAPDPNNS